jgi:hypothetical protein
MKFDGQTKNNNHVGDQVQVDAGPAYLTSPIDDFLVGTGCMLFSPRLQR